MVALSKKFLAAKHRDNTLSLTFIACFLLITAIMTFESGLLYYVLTRFQQFPDDKTLVNWAFWS